LWGRLEGSPRRTAGVGQEKDNQVSCATSEAEEAEGEQRWGRKECQQVPNKVPRGQSHIGVTVHVQQQLMHL
jgi:hypothetical protein